MAGPWEKYSQGMQVKPADPKLPLEVQRLNLQNAQTQQQFGQDARTAPFDYRKAAADAAKAEADARVAEAKAAEDARTAEAKKGADAESRRELASIIEQIDTLAQDAADNGGWFETGYTGSLTRDRPGTASFDLLGRVKGIQGAQLLGKLLEMKKASATGATGFGSLTEKEVELILSSIANLDPNQSQGLFLENVNRARDAALSGYRRSGGSDPKVDPSLQKADKTPPMVGGGQQDDKLGLSKDGFRDEIDPVLKGVAGRLGKMVSAGASDATLREFLQKNGVDPANTNIDQVMQFRRTPEFKDWQRANPGKAYPIGPDFYTNKVPLSGAQQLGNMAAQSAPGAFAISAGQAVSGNRLDDIANLMGGDGEAVNTGVQLSRGNSPTASFLGDLSGQAMLYGASSALPGLRALPNSFLGRVGEDALYGAYAGSGEGDTLGGIAGNTVGGLAGRGIGRAGGVAARGANGSASLRYLNDAQVPLTIGQIGRGSNSTIGNVVGGVEERAAGLPIFDAIIGSARRRGDEGFNRAAFREMGGSGATGARGVAEGQNLVNNAYSFLDNTNLPLDAQFAGSQAAVRAGLPDLPAFGREIDLGFDTINRASKGGSLPGRDWQSSVRSVRGDRSSIAGQPFAGQAVDALNDVEGNLMGLAARQGPAGTIDNLDNANLLNSRFQTLASALDNGPAQARGELFSPTRLDTAARQGTRQYGGRVASMKGNRPFYDLTKAGMDVMPSLTPDSGTAGRSLFYAALPTLVGGGALTGAAVADEGNEAQGAGIGAGSTILPTLALMALYSKGGQKGLQRALLGPRPKVFEQALKAIDSNPVTRKALSKRAAGMFGSAAARDLLLYPELEQGF